MPPARSSYSKNRPWEPIRVGDMVWIRGGTSKRPAEVTRILPLWFNPKILKYKVSGVWRYHSELRKAPPLKTGRGLA